MFYSGCLLIATPDLTDSIFERSIILICEHDENGAMGLIINKESPIGVKELGGMFSHLNKSTKQFLNGGPVNQDEVWVLHNIKTDSEVRKIINDDYFLTSNPGFLKNINKTQLDQQFVQFFLGYSGWASGQLESEIERGSWVTSPYHHEIIWNIPANKRWNKAMHMLGEDYACIAYRPKNADVN